MEPLELEIGRALRRARLAHGLTLRQVASLSDGRFRATSVAGYERGERSISLVRFIELCRFYGTSPNGLLADILSGAEWRTEQIVDLTALEALGSEEAAFVSGFVRRIRALRAEPGDGSARLRAGDLEILATAAGRNPEELAGLLQRGAHDDPIEVDST